MDTKKRRLSIKLTQEDFDTIHRKAEVCGKNITDYVLSCCLGKQIVVIPGMDEVRRAQRSAGNNLNRLVTLVNMGRVSEVNLTWLTEEFAEVSCLLRDILERGRWQR